MTKLQLTSIRTWHAVVSVLKNHFCWVQVPWQRCNEAVYRHQLTQDLRGRITQSPTAEIAGQCAVTMACWCSMQHNLR